MPDDTARHAQRADETATSERPQPQVISPSLLDQAIAATRVAPPAFLVPDSFESVERLAKKLCAARWVPKAYLDKQNNPDQAMVEVAIMHGMELGIRPMAALQGIAVINGMPAVWGDLMVALVRASGLCEWIKEGFDGQGDDLAGVCTVKRKNEPAPVTKRFRVKDAQQAGLWTKAGPWTQYPWRMLGIRARAWALRDTFADVLKGMHSAEELTDMLPAVIAETERRIAADAPARPTRARKEPEHQERGPEQRQQTSAVEEITPEPKQPAASEPEPAAEEITAEPAPERDTVSEDEAFARALTLQDKIADCRSVAALDVLEQTDDYKEIQYWPAQQRDAVAHYLEEHRTKLQRAAAPKPKAGQGALAGLEP